MNIIPDASQRAASCPLYDDTHESQRMALHGARKQAQTGAERSQDAPTAATAR